MATTKEGKRPRIAIIGGGLAGATVARGLLKHPYLDVKIYESAPEFSERGAGVGIQINGQRALREIGVEETLAAAGAVITDAARMVMGIGPDAGEMFVDTGSKDKSRRVHRAAFLSQLLKPVPKESMLTNKKLLSIEAIADGEITLSFKDGTEEHADVVIGADGVHGQVRKYILGADNPALNPSFAGFWACTNLVPIAKAKEVLGDECMSETTQRSWSGDGVFYFLVLLNNGETVQCFCGAMTDETWDPSEWKRDVDRKMLEDVFGELINSPTAKGVIELLLADPQPQALSIWHHAQEIPSYTKGRVCMMGDAAHCMTPWQASGAGQAIEDAMILETLLGTVKEPRQLEAALKAYDEVRRPRTQQIVASSAATGKIFMGRAPGIGINIKKLKEALSHRWDFILDFDMKEHKKAALTAMSLMEQRDELDHFPKLKA